MCPGEYRVLWLLTSPSSTPKCLEAIKKIHSALCNLLHYTSIDFTVLCCNICPYIYTDNDCFAPFNHKYTVTISCNDERWRCVSAGNIAAKGLIGLEAHIREKVGCCYAVP